jgi:hypothetical protein
MSSPIAPKVQYAKAPKPMPKPMPKAAEKPTVVVPMAKPKAIVDPMPKPMPKPMIYEAPAPKQERMYGSPMKDGGKITTAKKNSACGDW